MMAFMPEVVLVHRSRAGCEPTEAAFAFMPYAESTRRNKQADRAAAISQPEHDPEKREPVFRRGPAKSKCYSANRFQFEAIAL
jgi:hypothetical protein